MITWFKQNATVVACSSFVFLACTLPATASTFSPFDLGTAGDYSLVATGTKVKINSEPIAGNALIGNDVDVDFSGGNNGGISGTLFYDQSIVDNGGTSEFNDLENPGLNSQVADSVVDVAVAYAETASTDALALGAGLAFTGQNIVGVGGLNVFSAGDLNNPEFSITGTMADFFVFNVSGKFQTNKKMTLNGIDASQILWNLTGTDTTVLQTSGGNELFGTFLATGSGAKFQGSNLVLNGALINTAGHVEFVSGSTLPTFTPLAAVPLPAGLPLFACAFGTLALLRRAANRRRGQRRVVYPA